MNEEQQKLYDSWSKRDIYEAYLNADKEATQAQERYNKEVLKHLVVKRSIKIDEVKEVTIKEIFKYPELFIAYAEESKSDLTPDIEAKEEVYQAIEDKGVTYSIACYNNDQMIGFAVMLNHIMLHYDKQASTIESIFVLKEYRKSGAGVALLNRAMSKAKEIGSCNFFLSAPLGSSLTKATKGFGLTKTHEIFTKAL